MAEKFNQGPKVFIQRLQSVGKLPEDILLLTSSKASYQKFLSQSDKKYTITRLDGVSYYKASFTNVSFFLKQRYHKMHFILRFLLAFLISLIGDRNFNKILDRFTLRLMANSDAIIFQSKLSLAMHEKFLGFNSKNSNFTIILNGVDTSSFYPIKKQIHTDAPQVIISASLYRPHKRLQDAILLINHLSDQYPRIQLHILGELDPLVSMLLEDMDLSRCIFHGTVDVDQLPKYYSSCDIQLSLSLFDPCPNVVCEGLACGLPVISPLQSGASEILGDKLLACCIDESVSLNYSSYHTPGQVPVINLIDYSRVFTQIYDNILYYSHLARKRAVSNLDIKYIHSLYINFMSNLDEKSLNIDGDI